ncbi:Apolipoprotein N-acyltransferase [Lysobacter dokdonensis DS-58]|uniref:Apolipoprotein N-acyltransferase n=1 Tax=Lysobacter dokdonensis DS-58 TaxID=1300345 RepID=A0A0A2X5Q3_9GAMM|nr:HupE/UreJ family protein [Lysobacter dokdonensis]KGQ20569.1 Apolipoprotein N-acyltransferase [Lysobacter dokdonensis DS-58]
MTRIACLLSLLLVCATASAHTLSVSHVDLVEAPNNALDVEVDLSLRDIALTLPLDRDRDEQVTWGELQAVEAPLRAMVESGLSIRRGGQPCELTPTGMGTRAYDEGTHAALRFRAACANGGRVDVGYGLMFDRDPQHRALVTLRAGAQSTTAIARADARDVALAVNGDNDGGATLLQFVREGIHHILIGYDHLAFLVSLLLTSALIRTGGTWSAAPNPRAVATRALGIVTAFTLAHSVTLSLAALGWVVPASRIVESAIAASVVLAALNNVFPVVERRAWIIGFAFGLVHGFGFAGALAELGLSKNARLLSLVGFNLGVELGQLLVVAVALTVLLAIRYRAWYARRAMPAASLAIAGCATVWMVQRLAA